MLIRVGMVGVIWFGLAIGVSSYQAHAPINQAPNANDLAPAATPTAVPEPAYATDLKSNSSAEGSKEKPYWISLPNRGVSDWIAYGANIALVIIGIAGIGVGVFTVIYIRTQTEEVGLQRLATQDTLEAIKRQADLMETQAAQMKEQTSILRESVEAATLSAAFTKESFLAMKSKERARLTLKVGDINYSYHKIDYRLTCHGTTPAFLIESWHFVGVVPVDDSPWCKGDYGLSIHELPEPIPVGVFNDYFLIHNTGSLLTPREGIEEEIKRGDSYIQFRMFIRYMDIFDDIHTLYVSKIYGVKIRKQFPLPQSLYRIDDTEYITAILPLLAPPSPQWRDSLWRKPEGEGESDDDQKPN